MQMARLVGCQVGMGGQLDLPSLGNGGGQGTVSSQGPGAVKVSCKGLLLPAAVHLTLSNPEATCSAISHSRKTQLS